MSGKQEKNTKNRKNRKKRPGMSPTNQKKEIFNLATYRNKTNLEKI